MVETEYKMLIVQALTSGTVVVVAVANGQLQVVVLVDKAEVVLVKVA